MNDFDPSTATNFQLIEQYEQMLEGLDQLDAALKIIREELCDRLVKDGTKGTNIGDWEIKLKERHAYPDMTLERAADLGAVTSVKSSLRLNLKRLHDLKVAGADITETTEYYVDPKRRIVPDTSEIILA